MSVVSGNETSPPAFSFEELVIAYFDCRKNKRGTLQAMEFEIDREKNLMDLYLELIEDRYEISRSIAFVVTQPKIREIWAAGFRDRIVHHLIYNRLFPKISPSFIRDSFACIEGRGSLDAVERLSAGIRSLTENHTKPCYFLQADIRNFFLSIDKNILAGILKPQLQESWFEKLVHKVLYHDPRVGCWAKSPKEAFDRVPRHKSLWHTPMTKGLPIGNLTSQFYANVYLNELDQFVKHKLRAKRYYRYVDDFVILDEDPRVLHQFHDAISEFLRDRLALELHPFKKQINRTELGIDFVGFIVRPHRRYMRRRTVNKVISQIHQWKKSKDPFSDEKLQSMRASLNSYFGFMIHTNSHRLRKEIAAEVDCLFIRSNEEATKFIVGAG